MSTAAQLRLADITSATRSPTKKSQPREVTVDALFLWLTTKGPVFCVEGFSDSVVFAGTGMSVIARSNNITGGSTIPLLLDEQQLVIFGENDKKPNGRWPGQEGAMQVAADYCKESGRACLVVFPPEQHKDIRKWWHAFCDKHGYDRAHPTAAAAEHWRNTITSHVKQFGKPHGVDDLERQHILSRKTAAADERATDAKWAGDCGIWYGFKKHSDKGNDTRFLDLKIRCKKNNSCPSCAALKEAEFVHDVLRVWQVHVDIEFIYRIEVDHEQADKVKRKVNEAGGGYAWFRMSPERTRIYTEVPIDGARLMDAAEAADYLHADAENSDRTISLDSRFSMVGPADDRRQVECERTAQRMGKSRSWTLDDEGEDTSDLIPYGPITRHAAESAAQMLSVGLDEVSTPDNPDYRELLSSSWIDEATCDELADRAMALDQSYRLMKRTTVTFRSSDLPITNSINSDIGNSDIKGTILRNHSTGYLSPPDNPPSVAF